MVQKSFKIDLTADSNLQVVIKAHLLAEQRLYLLLTENLKQPEILDLDRLSFHTKARLAGAMGLFTKEVLAAYLALNRLRNKLAHELDYQFTEEDKTELLAAVPKKVVDLMLKYPGWGPLKDRKKIELMHILHTLISLVEARRRGILEDKQREAEALAELQKALEMSDRVLNRTP